MKSFHRTGKLEKNLEEGVSSWAPRRNIRAFLVAGEPRTLLRVDMGLHIPLPVWARKVALKLAPRMKILKGVQTFLRNRLKTQTGNIFRGKQAKP